MRNDIDILLPVYNGEIFLHDLFSSLEKQLNKDFDLLVYDDGSNDNSLQIIKSQIEKQSFNCRLCGSDSNVGIIESINILLKNSSKDYLMFCDQDDFWLPDKIEKTLKVMHENENKYGKNTPLLVFTDLYVTDMQQNIISDSFYKFQKLNTAKNSLSRILVQNLASGCTIMANRALVDLAGDIPGQAVMHDHWYSMVASAFGKMIYIDEPTLYYRQHADNFYGASLYGWKYFYKRYQSGIDRIVERFYQNVDQAQYFLQRYRSMLSPDLVEMLEEFSTLRDKSWLEKRKVLLKYKILKSGWRRNVGTMLII